MANRDTYIANGLVQPRFYQAYQDIINSKQAMEPLAVSQGVGPVLGFNNLIFEPSDSFPTSVKIRGFNSMYGNDYYNDVQRHMQYLDKYLELPKPQTHFLSVEEGSANTVSKQGAICNALILPSGRLYIEKPEIGSFPISYSSSPTEKIYILVARENILYKEGAPRPGQQNKVDYYWIVRNNDTPAIFTDNWDSIRSLGDLATLRYHLMNGSNKATCVETIGNSTSHLKGIVDHALSSWIDLSTDFIVGYYVSIGSNSFPTYNDYYGNTPMAGTMDSYKLIPLVAYGGKFPVTVKPIVYTDLYQNLRTVSTYPVSTQPPSFDIDSEVPFSRLKLVEQDSSDTKYEDYENRVIGYSTSDTKGLYFMYEEE
jgi:hypothetical protein